MGGYGHAMGGRDSHSRLRAWRRALAVVCAFLVWTPIVTVGVARAAVTPALAGPLHTTGTDRVIYDRNNRPVRLLGFNWEDL